jgi:hypothetical protein
VEITPFVTTFLVFIGWLWALRAGAAIQRYKSQETPRAKHIAIGNTIVSALPFALAVWLNWPR